MNTHQLWPCSWNNTATFKSTISNYARGCWRIGLVGSVHIRLHPISHRSDLWQRFFAIDRIECNANPDYIVMHCSNLQCVAIDWTTLQRVNYSDAFPDIAVQCSVFHCNVFCNRLNYRSEQLWSIARHAARLRRPLSLGGDNMFAIQLLFCPRYPTFLSPPVYPIKPASHSWSLVFFQICDISTTSILIRHGILLDNPLPP